MPYVIESVENPDDNKSITTQWTIEINYYDKSNDSADHYSVICIYGSTLDLCLLRAKTICNILNATEFEKAIITLNGFYDAKSNG